MFGNNREEEPMLEQQQGLRMGSLLRHVTFKTAALGFTSLLIAGVVFIYYPSEDLDNKASLSKVHAKDQQLAEPLLGAKAVVQGQLEPSQQCRRIDLATGMSWDDLKSEAVANTKLEQKKGFLNDVEGTGVFYREVLPVSEPKGTLLFLHGMKFKSQTWLDLGTLHYMACQGYRAVAIDLPGFGDSPKADVPHASFMVSLMSALGMKQAVICSPSMSGQYSIHLLKEHPEVFKGYVPVAPVATDLMTKTEYEKTQVQTLIAYGENDNTLGQASLNSLKELPNKHILELKGAGHAAYLDKPLEFHQALLEFCDKLYM